VLFNRKIPWLDHTKIDERPPRPNGLAIVVVGKTKFKQLSAMIAVAGFENLVRSKFDSVITEDVVDSPDGKLGGKC
jgi:hypothetical protein